MKVKIRVAVAIGLDGDYSVCEDGGHGADYKDAMEAACVWLMEKGGGVVIDRFWLHAVREVAEPTEVQATVEGARP